MYIIYIIFICLYELPSIDRINYWRIYESVSQSVSMSILEVLKSRRRIFKPIFITSRRVECLLSFQCKQRERNLANFPQSSTDYSH